MHGLPRIITYHQTIHDKEGRYVSILPFVVEEQVRLTHLIIGAFHLNEQPGDITLNDDKTTRFAELWTELETVQYGGVYALAMIGGAAKGTFARLDTPDNETFLAYYLPLRDILREHTFDGVDLDIEEEMTLTGVIRLIDRLRIDFGPAFIITLAPVATALHGGKHLSGFDYARLELERGSDIDWYNVQFYSGFAMLDCAAQYELVVCVGFPAYKLVMGFLTNPENGYGYVSHGEVTRILRTLKKKYPDFGGTTGWEYFNSLSEDNARKEPWAWASMMHKILHTVDVHQ